MVPRNCKLHDLIICKVALLWYTMKFCPESMYLSGPCPDLVLTGVPVARLEHTKHLGVYLDSGFNFSKHIREALKGVSILKYLSTYVNRNVIDLSYKLYVRPHLDYGDVIYHNQRDDLMKLMEQVQYKTALIVSGCWQGTSREKLYDDGDPYPKDGGHDDCLHSIK